MSAAASGRWPMIKSVLSTLVGLIVLGLFLAWMGGAFSAKVAPGEVPTAKTSSAGRNLATVELSEAEETIAAVGAVQPRRKTDVASQIVATVRDVKVQPGDKVKPQQELIILDDRELVAQQRESLAGVAVAEEDVAVRKRDYERIMNLPMGSASKDEKDRVTGAYNVAQAQLKRSNEQVKRIEVLLSYTKILASSGGVVAERFVDPGDLASPGKPLLVVQDISELELHAAVPESQALSLSIGQKLPLRIDAANVVGMGTVREVVPIAQQASRSVLVKVSLPTDLSAPVYAGMFGRVTIPVGRSARLLAPAAAVRHVGQLELVDVVTADGHLERRFVRTGRVFPDKGGDKVEILSGLNKGDRVALN